MYFRTYDFECRLFRQQKRENWIDIKINFEEFVSEEDFASISYYFHQKINQSKFENNNWFPDKKLVDWHNQRNGISVETWRESKFRTKADYIFQYTCVNKNTSSEKNSKYFTSEKSTII